MCTSGAALRTQLTPPAARIASFCGVQWYSNDQQISKIKFMYYSTDNNCLAVLKSDSHLSIYLSISISIYIYIYIYIFASMIVVQK